MPCSPGTKIPGQYRNGAWFPMSQWSQWCDKQPPDFLHEKWEDWPDAGMCLAHGAVVGLDVDTDRREVSDAAQEAVGPSPVRRVGRKGWMGYYRPGEGLAEHAARLRWYDPEIFTTGPDGKKTYPPQVELLLNGTQSVLPPTIHPDTKQPYRWISAETLEDAAPGDLPEMPPDAVARLDAAFKKIGLTREAPRRPFDWTSGGRSAPSDVHDLEKPWGRSLCDRAMKPEAIDRWWPALDLPKSRQRGRSGCWEAVPAWRGSNSGRSLDDRNRNLKITPDGIEDFGGNQKYSPLNLVITAKNFTVAQAGRFLEQYVEPEAGLSLVDAVAIFEANFPELATPAPPAAPPPAVAQNAALFDMLSRGTGRARVVTRIEPVSREEFLQFFPKEVPPFPVRDYENDLTGLLRDLTICIDEAANMRSEQGALGAALALLGTILGHKVEVAETGLRTNLYVVGTAASGAGKSSAMSAMMKIAAEVGVDDRIAGSDFTSGAAILKEMDGVAPRLFPVDEFGDVMRRALNPRAASHERDIGKVMKDLYSAASGTYKGKSYSTQSRVDIIQPHMCIYGVSTYESFWEGIDGRSFNDGLLARFISIPIGATQPQPPKRVRFDEVAEGVRSICQHAAASGNLAGFGLYPQAARIMPAVKSRWMEDRALYQRHADRAAEDKLPGAPSIINRICENGMKIAMISAASRNIAECEIMADDYRLGMAIAHWSAISMIEAIGLYYVENESHRNLKRILAYIESGGKEGRSRTKITQHFQGVFVNKYQGDQIFDTLITSGDVVKFEERRPRGRPVEFYIAAKFAQERMQENEPENPSAEN